MYYLSTCIFSIKLIVVHVLLYVKKMVSYNKWYLDFEFYYEMDEVYHKLVFTMYRLFLPPSTYSQQTFDAPTHRYFFSDGTWTHENDKVTVTAGDTIYYWILFQTTHGGFQKTDLSSVIKRMHTAVIFRTFSGCDFKLNSSESYSVEVAHHAIIVEVCASSKIMHDDILFHITYRGKTIFVTTGKAHIKYVNELREVSI